MSMPAFDALYRPDSLQRRTDENTGPAARRRWLQLAPEIISRRIRPTFAASAVIIAGIGVITVAQLLLSIGLSDGAYEISSLQATQKELARTTQGLTEHVQTLQSPQYLVQNAAALGMVANGNTVFLRLSDGAVLGQPAPAAASASTISAGLVANQLVPATALAGAAAEASAGASAGAAAAGAIVASAPAVPKTDPTLPWQGALPSPTTR
jgi:cell division protein FtsB